MSSVTRSAQTNFPGRRGLPETVVSGGNCGGWGAAVPQPPASNSAAANATTAGRRAKVGVKVGFMNFLRMLLSVQTRGTAREPHRDKGRATGDRLRRVG